MMRELRIELPWPPSINKYWRRHGHVIHVSTEGTRFARRVALAVRSQFGHQPIACPVAVLAEMWYPGRAGMVTRQKWDVDNRLKPLLDALTFGQLWVDDEIVRDIRGVDRSRVDGCVPGGAVVLWVRPL